MNNKIDIMAIKIKATNELLQLAENMGNVVHTKRDDYYYFPFWIKVKHDNSKEIVAFDKLPDEVKQYITEKRKIEEQNEKTLIIEVDAEHVKPSRNA